VTDENMPDTMKVCLKAHELHLCAFSAVDHEMPVLYPDELCGRKPPIGRKSATGTKYCNLETHPSIVNVSIKENDQNSVLVIVVFLSFFYALVTVRIFQVFFDLMHKYSVDRFFNFG
jgi:hypothetical protein